MPMSEENETMVSQDQEYCEIFRALLRESPLAMLSFLYKEEFNEAHEIEGVELEAAEFEKNEVHEIEGAELEAAEFEREEVTQGVSINCVYLVHSGHGEKSGNYIGNVRIETVPNDRTGSSLFGDFALLLRKYALPTFHALVCPFEVSYLPTSPFEEKLDDEVLTTLYYKVVALWQREASELLERKSVELYTLLPTLQGATYAVLTQALQEMKHFYVGQESKFRFHLQWFNTLLDRSTTVTAEDKQRIRANMSEFSSLFEEKYAAVEDHLTRVHAEALAEAKVEAYEAGLIQGLREALLVAVELRFPDLLKLAKEKVLQIEQVGSLRRLLREKRSTSDAKRMRYSIEELESW